MQKKRTYEESQQQRVKELEKEAVERKRAEEELQKIKMALKGGEQIPAGTMLNEIPQMPNHWQDTYCKPRSCPSHLRALSGSILFHSDKSS